MRLLIACILFAFSFSLSAQLNDHTIYVDTKAGSWEQIEINSSQLPEPVYYDTLSIDSVNFDATASNDIFLLNFKARPGVIGNSKIILEYYDQNNSPGLPNIRYSSIHTSAKTSKVIAAPDFKLSTSNSGSIYPLSNDISTDSPLEIVKIGYAEGCTASITGSDEITYDLVGSVGEILYFIEDSLGNVSSGKIHLELEDDNVSQSFSKYTDNKGSYTFTLPSDSYTISSNVTDGLLYNVTGHIWTYSPEQNFVGTDAATFISATGALIDYEFNVLNHSLNGSFIVDDEFYVPSEGSMIFDVLENDLRSNLDVVYHSPELTEVSNGVFEYTPPTGFEGDQIFLYKVLSGTSLYTGYITVHTDDFSPLNENDYSFEIVTDQTLSIEHNSPIEGYDFEISVAPSNGSVVVVDQSSPFIDGCDSLSQNQLIVYTPNQGYSGSDEFDIEFCSASGVCGEIVKVDVQIISSNNTDCLCTENCVFQGDHNDDGVVDVKDLLDLGLNIGKGGSARTNDFEEVWTGQFSNDWGHTQLNSIIDLKCGDSDGDGYIDSSDLDQIVANYGNSSRFHSSLNAVLSDVPISFVPQSTDIDSGEVLYLDILVGDSSFPAIDYQGISFSLNVDPELMDSSSVIFTPNPDSWLADNSFPFEFFISPEDGKVDIGITRTGRGSADGFGLVGVLSFIIEDELAGFREEDYFNSTPITITNAISVDYYGNYKVHPDFKRDIILDSKVEHQDTNTDMELTISAYPNPTNGLFTIDSEIFLIDRIQVLDVTGRILSDESIAPHFTHSSDLSDYSEGIYLIKIYSQGQLFTKKVYKTGP